MNFLKSMFRKIKAFFVKAEKVATPVAEVVAAVGYVGGKLYLEAANTKFQQFSHLSRILLCMLAKEKECTVDRLAELENEITQRIEVLKLAGIEVPSTKEGLEALIKKYK